MAFTKLELAGHTRSFFAARLTYSRFMNVGFQTDMREETLLRCLIACFQTISGVPWVVNDGHYESSGVGSKRAALSTSASIVFLAKDVNYVSWRWVRPSLRALSLCLYCPSDLTEHALRPDKD
jgi:hypothetical protein